MKGVQVAEALVKLKKRAIKAGMKKSEAKTASRGELEEFLNGGSSKKSTKAKAKKSSSKKSTTKKTAKSENKAKKTKTKKASSKKSTKASSNGDAGRLEVGRLKYTGYDKDEWKPREGSPVERIFKALKQHKDDVEAVFKALKPKAKEFAASKTAPDGSRRTKEWFEKNLRYRINRTRFEFAVKTGQHEVATNRVQYGKGDYAKSTKKSSKKAKTNSKAKTSTKKAKKGKKAKK
jgi:hypothetical protein